MCLSENCKFSGSKQTGGCQRSSILPSPIDSLDGVAVTRHIEGVYSPVRARFQRFAGLNSMVECLSEEQKTLVRFQKARFGEKISKVADTTC